MDTSLQAACTVLYGASHRRASCVLMYTDPAVRGPESVAFGGARSIGRSETLTVDALLQGYSLYLSVTVSHRLRSMQCVRMIYSLPYRIGAARTAGSVFDRPTTHTHRIDREGVRCA